jgi:hypothetical protein
LEIEPGLGTQFSNVRKLERLKIGVNYPAIERSLKPVSFAQEPGVSCGERHGGRIGNAGSY